VGAASVGWPGEAAAAQSTTSLPGGVSLSPVPSLPPGLCRANSLEQNKVLMEISVLNGMGEG